MEKREGVDRGRKKKAVQLGREGRKVWSVKEMGWRGWMEEGGRGSVADTTRWGRCSHVVTTVKRNWMKSKK